MFTLLPPDFEDIPEHTVLLDASIAIQAFVLNVFGCIENLAWMWVEEKSVRKENGETLAFSAIGLGEKCLRVRQSLSDAFRALLDERKEWFDGMESYRHALAHRIPLYIPPNAVTPENRDKYMALRKAADSASLSGDRLERIRLEAEQRKLEFFRPLIMHSYSENAQPIAIHWQMLADFHTIEEFGLQLLKDLN